MSSLDPYFRCMYTATDNCIGDIKDLGRAQAIMLSAIAARRLLFGSEFSDFDVIKPSSSCCKYGPTKPSCAASTL